MSRTVLITGASGFIGRHLWRRLVARGERVVALTTAASRETASGAMPLRLPDPGLPELLARERPEVVVHCAGGSSVAASLERPEQDFHDNVVVTEHLLAAVAALRPIPRVVFPSSAAVYGQPDRTPISESAPLAPISPYGHHKLIAERVLRKYHELARVPVQILRFFSVYGPGLRKQVLWDISRQYRERPVVVLDGDGSQRRDFLYVDDAVAAFELAIERGPFDGSAFNVASGRDVSLRELADMLLAALGGGKRVAFTGRPRPGDPRCWKVDVARIRELGLAAGVPLEEGVRRYAAWAMGIA